MLLCCVCIISSRGDDVCGTVGEVADERVAAAAAAAEAPCAPRPLPPRGVAACCASVMTVSDGESDMANTMRWGRTGTDACGECAGGGAASRERAVTAVGRVSALRVLRARRRFDRVFN